MPKVTIKPGDIFPFDVGNSGKYLLIRFTDHGVSLGSDNFRSQGIQTGDAINVEAHSVMRFENGTEQTVSVDYQITDLKVATNATQNLVIQRIIDPIQFEASVKVVDGLKVDVIAAASLNSLPDITIQPGETVKVTSNAANREKVAIQVISESVTTLRVGGANVAVNVGALLVGSVNAPASMSVDTSGDVWVFNTSQESVATVAVSEVIK
ncbi:hypothetical protein [Vibrio fluvialis]|uniref:hypothetical protein n=1 Tax=Vibrio fluvialis TaxID=676 RepID=UPI003D7C8975